MTRKFLIAFAAICALILLSGCLETLFPYGLPGQGSRPDTNINKPPPAAPAQPSKTVNVSKAKVPQPLSNKTSNVTLRMNKSKMANASSGNLSLPNLANGTQNFTGVQNQTAISNGSANVTDQKPPATRQLNQSNYPLEIIYFNVGFGDATLIRRGNFTMLLDSGPNSSLQNLSSTLASIGVTRLDVLALSSWDDGNVGGLSSTTKKLSIDNVWHNGLPTKSNASLAANALLKKSQIPSITPQSGDTYRFGDLEFDFYNPPSSRSISNDNLNSLVFSLRRGNFCAFFTGMLDQEAEPAVLWAMKNITHCQIYKLPNRGVGRESPSLIVERLTPEQFVLSVGPNNLGLPSPSTLERLRLRGNTLWRTSAAGNIYVRAMPNGTYSVSAPANLTAISQDFKSGFASSG